MFQISKRFLGLLMILPFSIAIIGMSYIVIISMDRSEIIAKILFYIIFGITMLGMTLLTLKGIELIKGE